MGSRYLTDLAAVVRAAGLVVQEEPGWQTRSRSSGGYNSGLPNHVMIHHTASGPSSDGQPDVNYMCYGSENRPVANLYLNRSGKVWIMAAGATNTNGSGSAPWGGCPNDSMNTHAIGIEAGNNGTGEPWPAAQQEAYVALVDVLCEAYGIGTGFARSHAEWSPQRKIDPAGPSRWAASGTWNEDAFRHDVATGGPPQPEPQPPPIDEEEMDMEPYLVQRTADDKVYAVHPKGCVYLQYGAMVNNYKALGYKLIPIDDQAWSALTKLYPVSK